MLQDSILLSQFNITVILVVGFTLVHYDSVRIYSDATSKL